MIHLDKDTVDLCRKFALDSAETQQPIEFGERVFNRKTDEVARDTLIGKLAEVAMAKFLYDQYGKRVTLDFGVYPRGVWDSCDMTIGNKTLDIKGTRSGGNWLLVDLNKLRFRQLEKTSPDAFVFAVVGWRNGPTGEVDLRGFALLTDMAEGVANTLYLPQGMKLPGTQVRLQTDNFARHTSVLRKDWDTLCGGN